MAIDADKPTDKPTDKTPAFRGQVTDIEPKSSGSLLDALRNAAPEDGVEDAISWIPFEENDGIEGTVIGISSYLSDGFGEEKLLRTWIVEEDAGVRWHIIPFHYQLKLEMARNRAEIGDRVAVLYLGETQSKTDPDKVQKNYRVARVSAGRLRRTAK